MIFSSGPWGEGNGPGPSGKGSRPRPLTITAGRFLTRKVWLANSLTWSSAQHRVTVYAFEGEVRRKDAG